MKMVQAIKDRWARQVFDGELKVKGEIPKRPTQMASPSKFCSPTQRKGFAPA